MKKSFVFVVILCLLVCLAACTPQQGSEQLNEKLKANYSQISLSVTTKYLGETLTSTVTTTTEGDVSTVTYSIQQFATFNEGIPESLIVTKQGTLTVEKGVITSMDGDEADIDVSGVSAGNLSFDDNYFKNANLTATQFTAEVSAPAAFLGTAVQCSDMKVSATFDKTFVKTIVITYTADGAEVTYSYQFTA